MAENQHNHKPRRPFRAIGSSYLLRQVAGSERLGGLRVTLYPRAGDEGQIKIELTDWHSGEAHEFPIPEYANIAAETIRNFASERAIELDAYDIRLDRFLFHDVDSHPKCYQQAARSAFRAALER